MNLWNQAPFIRLLLPFLTGIITAVYFPFQLAYSLYIILIVAIIIGLLILVPKLTISYRNSWWFGLIVNSALFIFSYHLTILNTEKFAADHFSKTINSSHYVYSKLTEPYLEKEKSLKVVVEVLEVKHGEKWKIASGKAMVYFKKDSHSLKLKYGDEIVMKLDFKEVPPPQNPGEFNYKRFLAFHNVYHQAYVKNSDWVYNGKNSGNILMRYSINLRDALLNVLKANHLYGDEFAVGSALLLGCVDKLDADIISAYSSTGALHVLSVSGLHVAIVYVIFNWLLSFFNKIKYGNIIKAILLILLLWFYAALTGLSPSVLRAATMFSFIIIAKAYDRYTNIYNTLAASAFLLLLIDPFLIMEVGFQLSYLAVIGIVYIQPKIYNWFEVKNWLLDQVWTITSVSIAAQIATFPLGLHYFHQFPNYFLLSNLIVIPISTAIIYLGIALFAFAKVSMVAGYLAMGFGWCVWLLNQSVLIIEKWPYALLHSISISVMETWLLYGLIILFFFYFANRKFNYLIIALTFAIAILCSQLIEQHQQSQQKSFIIYNIPKTSAMDFISAKRNVLLTDTAFANNKSGLLFRVKHNWWDLGISNNTIISGNFKTNDLIINNNFIQFYEKRIAIINAKGIIKNTKSLPLKPLSIDYLVISKNPYLNFSEIEKQYKTKIIIFDSSNSEYNISKWKSECNRIKQSYYSVMDSGAFVVNL
ncbi:MAG: ComEC/Rec2 family competence protein [Bacteroidota bacterium]